MFYYKQKRGAFRGKYRLNDIWRNIRNFFQKLPLCFTTEQKQHVLPYNIIMVYKATIRLFCISQRKKRLETKSNVKKTMLQIMIKVMQKLNNYT